MLLGLWPSPFCVRRPCVIWDTLPTPSLWEAGGALIAEAQPLAASSASSGCEVIAAKVTEFGRPSSAFKERPRVAVGAVVLASGGAALLAALRERLPHVDPSQLGEINPQVVTLVRCLEAEEGLHFVLDLS